MNKTLSKILICGLGSIGRRHYRVIRQLYPHVEIGALRSGHGQDSVESNNIDISFDRLDDCITWSPNAAIISSPAPYHLATALKLAKHKIPLLIEKPIGTGLESPALWNELLLISQELPILVGYTFRHDSCLLKVKDLIKTNAVGKLIDLELYCGSWLPEWRPNQNYKESVSSRKSLGGGVLLELSHELDIAFSLFSQLRLKSCLISSSGSLDIDVEDNAVILLGSLMCQSILIRLNFCTRPSRRQLLIRGTSGEISWNLNANQVSLTSSDVVTTYQSSDTLDDLYFTQLRHFISCIEEKEKPLCTVKDGINVITLVAEAKTMSS